MAVKLFQSQTSMFCEKIRIVFALKNVPYEIVDVRFSPIAIVLGGVLDVRITVKNTGSAPLHSWGPPPGYTYTAPDDNYASIRNPTDPAKPAFFERRGVWRVGVTWQNAPSALPLRWGPCSRCWGSRQRPAEPSPPPGPCQCRRHSIRSYRVR